MLLLETKFLAGLITSEHRLLIKVETRLYFHISLRYRAFQSLNLRPLKKIE